MFLCCSLQSLLITLLTGINLKFQSSRLTMETPSSSEGNKQRMPRVEIYIERSSIGFLILTKFGSFARTDLSVWKELSGEGLTRPLSVTCAPAFGSVAPAAEATNLKMDQAPGFFDSWDGHRERAGRLENCRASEQMLVRYAWRPCEATGTANNQECPKREIGINGSLWRSSFSYRGDSVLRRDEPLRRRLVRHGKTVPRFFQSDCLSFESVS